MGSVSVQQATRVRANDGSASEPRLGFGIFLLVWLATHDYQGCHSKKVSNKRTPGDALDYNCLYDHTYSHAKAQTLEKGPSAGPTDRPDNNGILHGHVLLLLSSRDSIFIPQYLSLSEMKLHVEN